MLAPFCAGVEVTEVTHRADDDFSGDMWIRVSYTAPGFGLPVDGGLEFISPMMAFLVHEDTFVRGGAEGWPEERESDLLLWYTQRIDAEETIRLPRGYRAAHLPAAEKLDETFALFEASSSIERGVLKSRARVEVRRRQIPPDGYGGFRRVVEGARDWAGALFRVEAKEAGE
jgi:hypothetical protein